MQCFLSLFLVVSTSVINCLERLVFEMTYYMSNGTLNPVHSLTADRKHSNLTRVCQQIFVLLCVDFYVQVCE